MTGRRTIEFDGEVERDILQMVREDGLDYDGERANAYRKAMRGTLARASCVYVDAWESLGRALLNAVTRRRDT